MIQNQNFFFNSIIKNKGIGPKINKYFNEKKIENNLDLLFNLPYGVIDRSNCPKLNQLEAGTVATLVVKVRKYNFPRIRKLPSTVFCYDQTGEINVVFFNSRETYIKEILPLESEVVISGKIGVYKNKFQITNPDYVVPLDNLSKINKIMPTYSSIKGISNKTINKIYEGLIEAIPEIAEWHRKDFLTLNNFKGFRDSLVDLHKPKNTQDVLKNSISYERLSMDEIFSNLLIFYEIKKNNLKKKKKKKNFSEILKEIIIQNLNFKLTDDQISIISEIEKDLLSEKRMLRLLQGDVGSGKTIISLITSANVIQSGHQVALMAPTEILVNQHLNLAKKLFLNTNIVIESLTGTSDLKKKNIIHQNLMNGKINFIIGTHALFQEKVNFFNLGLVIIDEQHKFGVKQRLELSEKGGDNCDLLLMTATPIPRTLILSTYGDMDVSSLKNKPFTKTKTTTDAISNKKINEVIYFLKEKIKKNDQIFWVCPLIDESKKLILSNVQTRYNFLKKHFEKIHFLHGQLSNEEKKIIMNDFLNKKIDVLVATTVVEVGIDNPNANTIVIENAERFGLSQLHQLRGRVGRGTVDGNCILVYSDGISENGKKRLKIMKESYDGFFIAEEDLKLRGFGDIIGFKQSGEKDFIIADPLYHSHLFDIAQKEIEYYEKNNLSFKKFEMLLKFFKKDKIHNIISSG